MSKTNSEQRAVEDENVCGKNHA